MTKCCKPIDIFYQIDKKMPEALEQHRFPLSQWNDFMRLWNLHFRWHLRFPIFMGVFVVVWCASFWVLAATITMNPFNYVAWFGLISSIVVVVVYIIKYRPTAGDVKAVLTKANDNVFKKFGVIATWHHHDDEESLYEVNEVRFRIRSRSALRRNYSVYKRDPNSSMSKSDWSRFGSIDYSESNYSDYQKRASEISNFKFHSAQETNRESELSGADGISPMMSNKQEFNSGITVSDPYGSTKTISLKEIRLSEIDSIGSVYSSSFDDYHPENPLNANETPRALTTPKALHSPPLPEVNDSNKSPSQRSSSPLSDALETIPDNAGDTPRSVPEGFPMKMETIEHHTIDSPTPS